STRAFRTLVEVASCCGTGEQQRERWAVLEPSKHSRRRENVFRSSAEIQLLPLSPKPPRFWACKLRTKSTTGANTGRGGFPHRALTAKCTSTGTYRADGDGEFVGEFQLLD